MAVATFQISVLETASLLVIRCEGELDIASVDQLRAAVDDALSRMPDRMHIACENVTFIDSLGIRALLHTTALCDRHGIVLTIGASEEVRRVLDTTGVGGLLSLVS